MKKQPYSSYCPPSVEALQLEPGKGLCLGSEGESNLPGGFPEENLFEETFISIL